MRAVTRQTMPGSTMDAAASALGPDLERAGSYVTLFHGRLDLTERRLRFVDAGHGHVFLHRPHRPVEGLQPRGLPIGMSPPPSIRKRNSGEPRAATPASARTPPAICSLTGHWPKFSAPNCSTPCAARVLICRPAIPIPRW
jgi:hypothetical protein